MIVEARTTAHSPCTLPCHAPKVRTDGDEPEYDEAENETGEDLSFCLWNSLASSFVPHEYCKKGTPDQHGKECNNGNDVHGAILRAICREHNCR